MPKAKFKTVPSGGVDPNDSSTIDPSTMYFEETSVPGLMDVHMSNGAGTLLRSMPSVGDVPLKTELENIPNSTIYNRNNILHQGTGKAGLNRNFKKNNGSWNGTPPDPSLGLSKYSPAGWTIAGTFENNSSSFGGTKPALEDTVKDLLVAMGRTGSDRRHGYAFTVAQLVQTATGPYAPINHTPPEHSFFRMIINTTLGTQVTGAIWARVISGAITNRITGCRLNGVDALRHTVVPNDGWVHLAFSLTYSSGYYYPLYIAATENAVVQYALPHTSSHSSELKMEHHLGPII